MTEQTPPPAFPRRAQPLLWTVAAMVLSGCMTEYDPAPRFTALESARIAPPQDASPGSCWARDVTPAIIETVTAQTLLSPATYSASGEMLNPARFATETRQEIVVPRREFQFETICAEDMTPQFISSLQRALQVRALYLHQITGTFDPQTDAAVRAYQSVRGKDTGLLTMETARELGLAPVVLAN